MSTNILCLYLKFFHQFIPIKLVLFCYEFIYAKNDAKKNIMIPSNFKIHSNNKS